MQIGEEQSEKQVRSGRQVVADMIHNDPLLLPIRLQNVFPQIMHVHLLLLRCEVLQVDGCARALRHLNLLLRTLTLLLLPHRFPVVLLYRTHRRQFEKLFTSVMQTLEGGQEG
jgi:hypothetical protein